MTSLFENLLLFNFSPRTSLWGAIKTKIGWKVFFFAINFSLLFTFIWKCSSRFFFVFSSFCNSSEFYFFSSRSFVSLWSWWWSIGFNGWEILFCSFLEMSAKYIFALIEIFLWNWGGERDSSSCWKKIIFLWLMGN